MERLIEMTRIRNVCLSVAFIDMEKAYDRVDIKKKDIWQPFFKDSFLGLI